MDTADLRDRIADAIAFHPGNRSGVLEQRQQVARILADVALAVVQPELDRLRTVEADHTELTRNQIHPLISCNHGIQTVPIAALAQKIAEKRDALAKLREACNEVDRLREDLALAVAHDRQPYPTAHAYEQACAALEKHRQRADRAEADRDAARASVVAYCERMVEMGGGDPQAMAAYRDVARAFRREVPDGS